MPLSRVAHHSRGGWSHKSQSLLEPFAYFAQEHYYLSMKSILIKLQGPKHLHLWDASHTSGMSCVDASRRETPPGRRAPASFYRCLLPISCGPGSLFELTGVGSIRSPCPLSTPEAPCSSGYSIERICARRAMFGTTAVVASTSFVIGDVGGRRSMNHCSIDSRS